ncbi:MAG: hypothetical protein AB7T31_03155 [Gemmatimonadales bacterium]
MPPLRAVPLAAWALLWAAASAQAQIDGARPTASDSVDILEDLKELQGEFEEYRQSRTPLQDTPRGYSCDTQIGPSMCIWYGGEEGEAFPAELREVQQARIELIRELSEGRGRIADPWILGQLVHYMAESRNLGEAERIARECGIAQTWWCNALLGYVLHLGAQYVEAEEVFREAIAAMPDSVRTDFTTPRYILGEDARERFAEMTPGEQERTWELFWRLSDPLFLFQGNDRLTDHWARWVVARNRRDAADPHGGEWDVFREEALIRYGMNTGYSRTRSPQRSSLLEDTRRMVGHHHPKSRGYLFPEEFLASPSDIPPESWITAPREARTWYAPPYAPDMRGLDTQVGRFRRGDAMLVIGAYRPTIIEQDGERVVSPWQDGPTAEPPYASLFLVPVDGGPDVNVLGRDTVGVLSLEARPGRYVSGLEVVDRENRRAWRARQGVVQLPLAEGAVDVSDLMILAEGAPLPETLDEAIPLVRPGVRLRRGETFGVVWETYGLRVLEPVRVSLGFTSGRPGFLTRVGEFLGVIEPDEAVDITFQDSGPDGVQSAFRSVRLELPDLDPGEYTLHLRLELAGRTPVVTSRPIVVVE